MLDHDTLGRLILVLIGLVGALTYSGFWLFYPLKLPDKKIGEWGVIGLLLFHVLTVPMFMLAAIWGLTQFGFNFLV